MNRLEKKISVNEDGQVREVEIYVQRPTNEILKMAERHKSKVWNQCIQEDILTKKELAVLMRRRGIWDEAKDKEEEEITRAIVNLEKELYLGKDGKRPKLSDGREIAIQIRKKRLELRDLIAERITLEENTADNLADNSRFDFLVAHCSFYKNGTPIYKSFEDYNKKSLDTVAFEAASLLGKLLYNIDSSFEKNLPENKFLKKFNLVNDDLSLIDPNNPEVLVDINGKRIDSNGYYLDEDGNRVDREGNKITNEGDYEIIDYENDLVSPAVTEPEKAGKRRKKNDNL